MSEPLHIRIPYIILLKCGKELPCMLTPFEVLYLDDSAWLRIVGEDNSVNTLIRVSEITAIYQPLRTI